LTDRYIFERLARGGEQTVHALTSRAGVSQPAVSKHLAVLKHAKLVGDRREGRETHYRAQPQRVRSLSNGRCRWWAAGLHGLKTVVTWTLLPAESGTLVRMEQSGFKSEQECGVRLAEVPPEFGPSCC